LNTFRRLSIAVALVAVVTAATAPAVLAVPGPTADLEWVFGQQTDIVQSGQPCDATNQGVKWPSADGVTDGVFSLAVGAAPDKTITNILLLRNGGGGGEWETKNCDGGIWGLAVTKNTTGKHAVNADRTDPGDIAFLIRKDPTTIYLHADDDQGFPLFNSGDHFQVTITFSDNSQVFSNDLCLISCS
jgi:hypothetical protein